MRVLMLNAFHWLKGGVERTVFDETAWLGRAGHEVGALRDRGREERAVAVRAALRARG
jgi:hypothetical protein